MPRITPARVAATDIVGDCEKAAPSPQPSPPCSMLAGPHPRSRAFGDSAPRAGRRRSGEREAEGPVRGSSALARPKSSTFTVPFFHLHVRGLQVAVDDAVIVRRFQRFGDLAGNGEGLFEGEALSGLGPEALNPKP